ncbi:MAG TPA: FHA domain-containing protein [Candidatus Dormibacteraeota bacterium]|nr:FHA domain-containing protein [Candidatus Dormibacteraeota bacterium]
MPRFLIHHAGENTRVFEILGDRPISIGRAKSSNLILDDASVSRQHAVVRTTMDGRWQIIDRSSANGVKINGLVVKEAVLNPNDEVVVGEYRLRFFEDSSAREMVTYGTAKLPPRVTKALSASAYSGSFLPVQPVGGIDATPVDRTASREERARSIEHENRLLALLPRVSSTLAELTSVDEIARRVLDFALEIDGAERGYAMLLDTESMGRRDFSKEPYGFQPAVIRYRKNSNASTSSGAPHLTISQSIIRQVMNGGMPLLLTDPTADPRFSASKSVVAAGIQSAMCAPLGTKSQMFGLLYVDNLSRRGMFTVDELNVFTVIAAQAGLAIDRARARSIHDQPQPSAARE